MIVFGSLGETARHLNKLADARQRLQPGGIYQVAVAVLNERLANALRIVQAADGCLAAHAQGAVVDRMSY